MKVYIITDQSAYMREIEYICKLFSSILDAQFLVQDLSTRLEKDKASIVYCHEKHFNLVPEFCRIKIIPNLVFWKHYLAKNYPKLKMMYKHLSVLGAYDQKPRLELIAAL